MPADELMFRRLCGNVTGDPAPCASSNELAVWTLVMQPRAGSCVLSGGCKRWRFYDRYFCPSEAGP